MQTREQTGRIALISLLLALGSALLYLPVLRHQFVNLDDQLYITENAPVRSGLSWDNARWAFTAGYQGNWHPLTWLSHMLDSQLYGLNPAGHHLTNLALHSANAVLLFLLLHRLTRACWRSALVAALFAFHPLHVESVAWASERKDVLSTLFFLLSVLAYSGYVRARRVTPADGAPQKKRVALYYALTIFSFALALMSKPMVVTLPFVLLLLDYWPFERLDLNQPRRWPAVGGLVLEKTPLFIMAAAASVITFTLQQKGGAVAAMEVLPLAGRLGNASLSYLLYLWKTVWPVSLSPFYPFRPVPFGAVPLAVIILASITAGCLIYGRTRRYLPVGWFWYAGTLVPVIGLVQVGEQSMADRYTYIPLIGIFLLVVWEVSDALAAWRRPRLVGGAAAATGILACIFLTHLQIRHWRDSESLFRQALAVTSENHLAHYGLADTLIRKGDIETGRSNLLEALRIRPNYPEALNELAVLQASEGRWDEASEKYRLALELRPAYDTARFNLGRALARLNRPEDASVQYAEAIRLNPSCVEYHNEYASLLAASGRLDMAASELSKSLELNPNEPATLFLLGRVALNQGKLTEAEALLNRALELRPGFDDARLELGKSLAAQGKFKPAAEAFREILKRAPQAQASSNLGFVLLLQGNVKEGVSALKEALKLNPEWPEVLNELAWIEATHPDAEVRDGPEAVRFGLRACELTTNSVARFLGTLDAAYAETGQFEEAMKTAKLARAVAEKNNESAVATAAAERITLYKNNRPFRMPAEKDPKS